MLLPVLVVLAGCQSVRTTRALGSLQAEYSDLVRTEAACQADNKTNEACLSDFPAIYGFIEAQAVEAIDARGAEQTLTEQQITIALYRLAAFAALKSNSGTAAAYGDRGLELCGSVQVKPPRDCALWRVVGHYEVVNQYAADVNCLIAGLGGCQRSFEEAATDFCRMVYKPLIAATDKARVTPFLPESMIAYLDAQPPRARDSQQALAAKLTAGLGFDALPRDPCQCVRVDASDPRFGELCGDVRNEPMATFKAECVRRALDRDENCPSL
jgi:hypothetical protein